MRKTRAIQLRVTDEEHASFNAKAKALGLSVSEWLRKLAYQAGADIESPIVISRKEPKKHKTFFKTTMKIKGEDK